MDLFIAVFASLFSMVNPLGAVPVFLGMTAGYSKKELNKTIFWTSIYFVLILVSFFLVGSYLLSFFGITVNAMRIAGGLVILSSGYGLLTGGFTRENALDGKIEKEAREKPDISFSPLAMPLLSGPGSISLLISLYAEYKHFQDKLIIISVVIATGVGVYAILRASPYLFKVLGVAGLNAITRIMGFIVMAIGVQYIIGGIVQLVQSLIK
jgi:multiple antibiotic resistance protein